MRLKPGSTLGPYEVLAPVGAGGMGEVYRARDQRLGRIVAIKLLSERFNDRLHREARAISALNHPNICQLYDICSEDGHDFLVMEYLEGETLAARLERGRIDYKEAIEIGSRIAEALDAAHSRGVVHRDLKPANVVLTASGVKLLDFGLAKVQAAAAGNAETSTATVTEPGIIAGTLPYMAPEQLESKPVDERTDIFALGVVLYEMITGKRPFSGSTPASLIGNIMAAEPRPLPSIQPQVPPSIDRVVQTCLAKDPDKRWRRAFDVSIALRLPPAEATVRTRKNPWTLVLAAGAAVMAATLVWFFNKPAVAPEPIALSIAPPHGGRFVSGVNVGGSAISPDGRTLALVSDSSGRPMLWLRPLASSTATVLPGTEDACCPFWAPDSLSVGFFANRKLRRIRTAGGPSEIICTAEDFRGASWNRNGEILFVPGPGQAGVVHLVNENGGTAKPITSFDPGRQEEAHYRPWFLPDGRRFLFWVRSTNPANTGIYISSIDKPADRTWMVAATSGAILQPAHRSSPAYLVWMRGRTLLAQVFDERRGALSGLAHAIAEDVGSYEAIGLGNFSISDTGVLVHGRQGVDKLRMMKVDSSGKTLSAIREPGAYFEPRLSPDGNRVALRISSADASHIWSIDLKDDRKSRITFGALTEIQPVWSPDGKALAFTTTKAGMRAVAVKYLESAGEEVQITNGNTAQYPTSWSSDGRFIAFEQFNEQTGADMYIVPVKAPGAAVELLRTPANESEGQFSPDGAWVAYRSDETGRPEIYVQHFTVVNGRPALSGKAQISTAGGESPRWGRDGKHIYFVATDSTLMSAPVQLSGHVLSAGSPRGLFKLRMLQAGWGGSYDVGPDDRSFIVAMETEEDADAPLNVLLNWPAKIAREK
jgi:Tol biopolymer transport system component